MTEAIGYVRVSTVEQAGSGLGLEAQRRALGQACRVRGLQLLEVFEDAGISSVARVRPGLDAALAAVEAGEGRVLVTAKLDRLARSLVAYAALVERSETHGWQLLALDAPDATTPQGKAMQGVTAVFAQLERQLTSQRTTEALAAARARGVRLGRPRYITDELERRICRLYRGGMDTVRIAELLTREGVHPLNSARWWPSSVRRVLERRGVSRRGRGATRHRVGARRTIAPAQRPAAGLMTPPPA